MQLVGSWLQESRRAGELIDGWENLTMAEELGGSRSDNERGGGED